MRMPVISLLLTLASLATARADVGDDLVRLHAAALDHARAPHARAPREACLDAYQRLRRAGVPDSAPALVLARDHGALPAGRYDLGAMRAWCALADPARQAAVDTCVATALALTGPSRWPEKDQATARAACWRATAAPPRR